MIWWPPNPKENPSFPSASQIWTCIRPNNYWWVLQLGGWASHWCATVPGCWRIFGAFDRSAPKRSSQFPECWRWMARFVCGGSTDKEYSSNVRQQEVGMTPVTQNIRHIYFGQKLEVGAVSFDKTNQETASDILFFNADVNLPTIILDTHPFWHSGGKPQGTLWNGKVHWTLGPGIVSNGPLGGCMRMRTWGRWVCQLTPKRSWSIHLTPKRSWRVLISIWVNKSALWALVVEMYRTQRERQFGQIIFDHQISPCAASACASASNFFFCCFFVFKYFYWKNSTFRKTTQFVLIFLRDQFLVNFFLPFSVQRIA